MTVTRPSARPLVLVVDDEEMIRTLVRSLLEPHGYQVVEAEDGEQAVQMIEAEYADVDLLITDVRMPGLTGPELATHVRGGRPQLPIIFISGYVGDVTMDYCANHTTECLAKPFTMPTMLAAVRRLLAANGVPA